MQAEHVVARCTWLTEFDERSRVLELQDFISRWSRTVFHDELERCFLQWCPSPQTWRLPALQLDLGEVALDDLAQALPLRLRAALDDAMRRLFVARDYTVDAADRGDPGPGGRAQRHADDGEQGGGAVQILDHVAAMKAFLVYFLHHGHLPWWCGRGENALEVLDRMLAAPDRAGLDVLRDVLHDVGRGELVRKRLVWQLGADRMARIVHVLEPWHGGLICGWTDNVCALQARRQIAPATPSGFRDGIWLTVLTHLLVDRGSVFNTIAFMRSSLWQTAQRYQLDYQQLLSRLLLAAEAMAPAGIVTHDFFVAISALCAHDLAPAPMPSATAITVDPDHWTRFQALLRHSGQGGAAGPGTLAPAVGDLFAALADEDPERMAKALRLQGHSASVREGLLRHFTADRLTHLVRVLAPHDHAFIIAHAEHAHALAEAQRWDGQTVWRVLLAYLLLAQGSYFHRRQLVHDTLQQMCAVQRLDLSAVLDLLIDSAGAGRRHHHRFALLAMLRDLRTDIGRRREPGVLPADPAGPAAGVAEPLRWPAALLLQALRQHLPPGAARPDRVLPALLNDLAPDQLWRQLESVDGDLIAQWLQDQPELLVVLTRERPLAAFTDHLLARLPPELRSPRETVRQWSAVLRQGGLWQGTSAVLERHLYDVFWQVGFDARTQAAGAGELLARMASALCQRLSITVAECLGALQGQAPWPATSPWLAACTWLQRRAGLADLRLASGAGAVAPEQRSTASPATRMFVAANPAVSIDSAIRRPRPGASPMTDSNPRWTAQDAASYGSPSRINNAGVVILQGFFMPFLERLGLVANKQFVNQQAQRQAVHYLQFLVSGQSQTQEQYLTLNKLLCGLPLHEPVEVDIEMTAAQVEICQSLLRSVIGYWRAIGTSSIDGFRGNWLVRDGALAQAGDHWDLIVDRRAYDVLLARAPFTYAVIKLPWMEKAIYVTWPT